MYWDIMSVYIISRSKASDNNSKLYVYSLTAPVNSDFSFDSNPDWSDKFTINGMPYTVYGPMI